MLERLEKLEHEAMMKQQAHGQLAASVRDVARAVKGEVHKHLDYLMSAQLPPHSTLVVRLDGLEVGVVIGAGEKKRRLATVTDQLFISGYKLEYPGFVYREGGPCVWREKNGTMWLEGV